MGGMTADTMVVIMGDIMGDMVDIEVIGAVSS